MKFQLDLKELHIYALQIYIEYGINQREVSDE